MLNLLSDDYSFQDLTIWISLLLGAMLVTTSCFYLLGEHYQKQRFVITNAVDQLQRMIRRETKMKNALECELKKYAVHKNEFRTIDDMQRVLCFLTCMAEMLPANSFLDSLIIEKNSLVFGGMLLSADEGQIKVLITLLRRQGYNPTLIYLEHVGTEKMLFKILIKSLG